MLGFDRQLELLPRQPLTRRERLEWIRARLEGLEYRQRAREQKRRANREQRSVPKPHQLTLADALRRNF